MRKGEAAALQWSDINLKERTITINKTLDFNGKTKNDLFGDSKTFNSKRTISIGQTLSNDLHFHLKYQNQNKTVLNDKYHYSTLFNAFSKILDNANLPKLPIHSLRHTHAVLLLESGASMKYILDRLGHGSMQIIADVYSHISKKIEKVNMQKFEERMNDILN